MKKNIIFNESCLETLKRFDDNSINMVVTSPPYNMNVKISKGSDGLYKYGSRSIIKEFSSKYENFDDNLPVDEYYNLHLEILKECIRVSDIVFYNIQIVTGSKRAWFKIIGELYDNLKEIIIWDKCNAQPAMQVGVLNRQSELILVFSKQNDAISRLFKQAKFARGTLNDVWQIKRGKKVNKSHGAVFPEELIEKIILNFTNEGDVIYDPFLGTGTTAVVSKRLNRNYLGSEIGKEYFDFCEERLK